MIKFCKLIITLICFPFLLFSSENLPIDVQQRIFIYETLKNYNLNNDSEIRETISKSFLDEKQKQELEKALDEQFALKAKLYVNVLHALINRVIPTSYIVKELENLENSGQLDSRMVKFISGARKMGYSYEGIFEFIEQKIIPYKLEQENKNQ